MTLHELKTSYKEIYPNELVLKLEHSGCHATFLDFNITQSNGKISANLYDKREDFSFFVVCMTNFHRNPSYCKITLLCHKFL